MPRSEGRVRQLWLWQLGQDEGEARGRAEGEALGRAEGEARALRLVCLDLARQLHPRVAARVRPTIDSCDEPETLHAWILQCPKVSGPAFAALVTGRPGDVTRSRTSRPSRGSGRRAPAGRRRRAPTSRFKI